MQANNYQAFTETTAVYKESIRTLLAPLYNSIGSNLVAYKQLQDLEQLLQLLYVVPALAGEAGESLNKLKKVLRDGADPQDIVGELRGVAYYLAQACVLLDIQLEDLFEQSYVELSDRQIRGVLHGSGDNR